MKAKLFSLSAFVASLIIGVASGNWSAALVVVLGAGLLQTAWKVS